MNETDESLRRLRGILASPALALGHEATDPRTELAALRRMGLCKKQAAAFLDALCAHGLLDAGARAVLGAYALPPAQAAARLLAGELAWPEPQEEKTWAIRESLQT